MDRMKDPVTPILHDLHYYSCVYDILGIKNNEWTFEYKNEKQEKQFKTVKFDEQDGLFLKFRNKSFENALGQIVSEYREFVQSNSKVTMTQQGNAGGLNIDDMAEVVRAMPAYQDKLKEYNIHIDLLTQIKKFWTDRNLPKVVEEEQSIATGKDLYGKSYRFKDFASIKESPTDSDRIRKILLLWLCTDLEDREVSTLKSGVVGAKPGEEKYMEA
jgi:hypothetical protein